MRGVWIVLVASCSFAAAPRHPARAPDGSMVCSAAMPALDTTGLAVGVGAAAFGFSARNAGRGAIVVAYPGVIVGAVYGIAALVGWSAYGQCRSELSAPAPKLVPVAKP